MAPSDKPRDPLVAYRVQQGPGPRAAAANWERLVRRIEAGEPAPALGDELESSPGAPHPRSRAWAIALAAAAAALIAARLAWPERFSAGDRELGAAAPYHHTLDPQLHSVEVAAPRRAAAPDYLIKKEEEESVPSDILLAPAPPPPLLRPAPSATGRAVAVEADLARELAAVRAAAQAVRDGDGAAALGHADGYLAEHPRGAFVPEAKLQRIDALCLLARVAEAQRDVGAFLAAYPDSPLRARVEAACISPHGSVSPRPSPD